MRDLIDALLEHAGRFSNGAVAIGHLQRDDEDAWDFVVVGEDLQPLVFWGETNIPGEGSVKREDGATLQVLASTPPGVQPSHLVPVPAKESGSPIGRIAAAVTPDGMETRIGEPIGAGQEPATGLEVLRSLYTQSVFQRKGMEAVADVDTADGGKLEVTLDWDQRPLLFWLSLPSDPEKLELMTLARSSEGDVVVSVDSEMRPLYSAEKLEQMRSE